MFKAETSTKLKQYFVIALAVGLSVALTYLVKDNERLEERYSELKIQKAQLEQTMEDLKAEGERLQMVAGAEKVK